MVPTVVGQFYHACNKCKHEFIGYPKQGYLENNKHVKSFISDICPSLINSLKTFTAATGIIPATQRILNHWLNGNIPTMHQNRRLCITRRAGLFPPGRINVCPQNRVAVQRKPMMPKETAPGANMVQTKGQGVSNKKHQHYFNTGRLHLTYILQHR